MNALIFAGLGAGLVTLVELCYRHQRHPFGDRKQKALGWWALLITLDALLALAIVYGLSEADLLRVPDESKPVWLQGLAVGVFGPLALRSPIRTKEIRKEQQPVGITYIYDFTRVYIFFAVDERMARLRRADVTNLRKKWIIGGVTVDQVAGYLRTHIEDHPQLREDVKDEALEAVGASLTLPSEEQQMDALIKLARARRFSSMRDHFAGVVAIRNKETS